MRKSAWKLLSEHPPALVRLYARRKFAGKNVVVMTMQEIAIASGLPLQRCIEISKQATWDGITVTEAERFIAGCGWDPLSYVDRNRKNAYARSCQKTKSKYHYLRSSPLWKAELLPLIQLLRSRLTS